jgi:hypothetical protein
MTEKIGEAIGVLLVVISAGAIVASQIDPDQLLWWPACSVAVFIGLSIWAKPAQ